MALTNAYLVTTKNLEAFLNAIQTAQAPERFNQGFLKDLEFTSSNDRLFIGLLKGLGFTDDSGVPQQRYYDFLDQGQSKSVLAHAIRDAYEDLFRINKDANKLSEDEIKGKLRTLTRGEKSDKVVGLMAKTFRGLCDYADWSVAKKKTDSKPTEATTATSEEAPEHFVGGSTAQLSFQNGGLHYNIQIHLPATRDSAVYDAIFRSMRQHLSS